jgi:uncharacterized protein YjbJ (UPF0337 family)
MKQSVKDKAKGKFHEVKGNVKETVGRAIPACKRKARSKTSVE